MKLKLLSKDQICEWFNPVLSGETSNNPFDGTGNCDTNFSPINYSNNNPFADILDNPPNWLNPDCNDDSSTVGSTGTGASRDTFGAMLINGVPLSSWGAMYAGNVQYQKQNIMTNFIDITNHISSYMNNINIQSFDDEDMNFELTNVIIQKIVPSEAGLGVNIYLSFDYDKVNFFANFYKFGVKDNTGYTFICQPLKELLPEEIWIRLSGKLKNMTEKWLQPSSGIYECIAKEVIVYNTFGQIGRLKVGDKIEVIKADTEKIQFNWNQTKWYVKTPTYWWFNYYFNKIK